MLAYMSPIMLSLQLSSNRNIHVDSMVMKVSTQDGRKGESQHIINYFQIA